MKKFILMLFMALPFWVAAQELIIPPPVITATKTAERVKVEGVEIATYTITGTNTGGTATHVIIIDRIPDGTEYKINSAGTIGVTATITYSHNGGGSYNNDQTNPVTHIQWQLENPLAPQEGFTVEFAVRIKDY